MKIRRKLIANEVATVLKECGITQPPVDVAKIARALGLKVVLAPDDGALSGFLLSDPDQKQYVIGVNGAHHINRRRFTIAHEIGHFVLRHQGGKIHIDANKTMQITTRSPNSSTGTDPHEVEANAFAAELLMPASFVVDLIDNDESLTELDDSQFAERLAKQFGVSTAAMSFRLANLGYIAL